MRNAIDQVVAESLSCISKDSQVLRWEAKERDWVNYFAFNHLLKQCKPGTVFHSPGQIGIEVLVPQPVGYTRLTAARDLVIWPDVGITCWRNEWKAESHPLAILEWKVHRPNRRNRNVFGEREWLRRYCAWQPEVLGYAIEVNWSLERVEIDCSRFYGNTEEKHWRQYALERSTSAL